MTAATGARHTSCHTAIRNNGPSIPADRCVDLSRFCLEQSIKVWESIEEHPANKIPAQSVPRVLRGQKTMRQ